MWPCFYYFVVAVFADVHVEFTKSIYTTNETEAEVEVCVSVVGQLGTNITLQLDTVSGTAEGKHVQICFCYYIHVYFHINKIRNCSGSLALNTSMHTQVHTYVYTPMTKEEVCTYNFTLHVNSFCRGLGL